MEPQINSGLITAGRTIQGIGGGGINTLVDIVICDLVPLRQRGKCVALMAAVWAVGTVVGPVPGGAFADGTVWQQLQRVERDDNAILTAAVVWILFALTWAGTAYAWTSWRILVHLILGLAGLSIFYGHQTSRVCSEPSIPLQLSSSGTATCALWIAFVHATATESGLYVLPITSAIAPFGITTGILIAVTGNTEPSASWGASSSPLPAACSRCWTAARPPAAGPASRSSSVLAFVRSFGYIWGIAIPTTIFNARVQELLYRVSGASLREQLADGGAYAMASEGLTRALSNAPQLMAEVLSVYQDSLRWVWWIGIPFGGIGLLICIPIKQLVLSEDLHTEFGLQDRAAGREER
ncbi:hypothetical protein DL769_004752 [Monosporascus sp. CRB-8-3]|nr:hypothetical protein DL769_004752 [Monosporascus sp. CRB-8-3]